MSEDVKPCRMCGEIKLPHEYVPSDPTLCRECKSKKNREYYKENKKEVLDRNKDYYEENKEDILLYKKEYYKKEKRHARHTWLDFYYSLIQIDGKELAPEEKIHFRKLLDEEEEDEGSSYDWRERLGL